MIKVFKKIGLKHRLLILADNLGTHKVAEVQEIMKNHNHILVFNVAYLIVANPIELVFGLLKKRLWNITYGDFKGLTREVTKVLDRISRTELRNRFKNCFSNVADYLQEELRNEN